PIPVRGRIDLAEIVVRHGLREAGAMVGVSVFIPVALRRNGHMLERRIGGIAPALDDQLLALMRRKRPGEFGSAGQPAKRDHQCGGGEKTTARESAHVTSSSAGRGRSALLRPQAEHAAGGSILLIDVFDRYDRSLRSINCE